MINVRIGEADTKPSVNDGHQLHEYWTKSAEGLAKWASSPHPWTALHAHLAKHMKNPDMAARVTSAWFRDVFGIWPSQRAKKGKGKATRPVNKTAKEAVLRTLTEAATHPPPYEWSHGWKPLTPRAVSIKMKQKPDAKPASKQTSSSRVKKTGMMSAQDTDAQIRSTHDRQQGLIPSVMDKTMVRYEKDGELKKYGVHGAHGFTVPPDEHGQGTVLLSGKHQHELGDLKDYTVAGKTGASNQLDFTMSHEIGHALDHQLDVGDRVGAFQAIADHLGVPGPPAYVAGKKYKGSLNRWVEKNKKMLSTEVSQYGSTSAEELLAEIWAGYSVQGDTKSPLVSKVGKMLQTAVKKNKAVEAVLLALAEAATHPGPYQWSHGWKPLTPRAVAIKKHKVAGSARGKKHHAGKTGGGLPRPGHQGPVGVKKSQSGGDKPAPVKIRIQLHNKAKPDATPTPAAPKKITSIAGKPVTKKPIKVKLPAANKHSNPTPKAPAAPTYHAGFAANPSTPNPSSKPSNNVNQHGVDTSKIKPGDTVESIFGKIQVTNVNANGSVDGVNGQNKNVTVPKTSVMSVNGKTDVVKPKPAEKTYVPAVPKSNLKPVAPSSSSSSKSSSKPKAATPKKVAKYQKTHIPHSNNAYDNHDFKLPGGYQYGSEGFREVPPGSSLNFNYAQRSAVEKYTGAYYDKINRQLRFGEINYQAKTIKDLDSAFAKTPPLETGVRVRRLMGDTDKLFGPVGSRVGGTFTDKGYVSTTYYHDPNDAGNFSGSNITIYLPPGTTALAPNGVGHFQDSEGEVLLPRDTKFKVKGDFVDNHGQRHIHLEVQV